MKHIFYLMALALLLTACKSEKPADHGTSFSFAFMTDLHLNMGDNNCFEGFEMAIDHARNKGIDFIITGGDNVDVDYIRNNNETAHALYQRFTEIINNSGIDFYTTIGNHDRFWDVPAEDPLYNHGLYEKYLGKTYYAFDHKGWQFIVLNTSNYVVDDEQKAWLSDVIALVPPTKPIILVAHVPFLSVYYPVLEGRYTSTDTFSNFKEVWDMFEGKNLKLVLQGHMHLYEEIKVKDIVFISAGAVSASWWGGPFYGTEEGYLLVHINGDQFNWEYIDYGWEAKK